MTIVYHCHPALDHERAERLLIEAFAVARDFHVAREGSVDEIMSLLFDAEPWLRHHLGESAARSILDDA